MSLGVPLSFAAARSAILTAGDLILVHYRGGGRLMLPALFYLGLSGLAGIGWRHGIILSDAAPDDTGTDRS